MANTDANLQFRSRRDWKYVNNKNGLEPNQAVEERSLGTSILATAAQSLARRPAW